MCGVCGGAGGRHFKPMRSGLITSQHPNSLEGLHPGHTAVSAGRPLYANKTNKHHKHPHYTISKNTPAIGLFECNDSVITNKIRKLEKGNCICNQYSHLNHSLHHRSHYICMHIENACIQVLIDTCF